jgi:predicted NACHT family NTPase
MSSNPNLNTIFERIANGEATEGDIQTLRQFLSVREGQNSIQIGKYNVNISEGRDIQIGDRTYYGTDAETIKEKLREVLQEKQKAQRSRNEKLLLQAVKEEVVARLKQSLHNAVLINLGKEVQPEQVKRPWSSDIKIGDNKREPIPDNTSILEIFDQEEIAGKLLILGNPGAGKTTTMLDLAKALVTRSQEDCDYPIPVLFNLSTWKDDKQSIRDWLVLELKSKYGV